MPPSQYLGTPTAFRYHCWSIQLQKRCNAWTNKALEVPHTLPEKNIHIFTSLLTMSQCLESPFSSILFRDGWSIQFLIHCDVWANRTRLGCHLHSPTDQLNTHPYHSSASVISVCLLFHQRSLVHSILKAL